jgi:osmoprotectant transport system substrate-binding protein
VAVVGTALALVACRGGNGSDNQDGGESLAGTTITVGSANFPEAVLLAELYGQALEARGAHIERDLEIGPREVYYRAIEDGEVQLVPEYTNSLLSFVLADKGQSPKARNVPEQVQALKTALPPNLTILTPSTAEDKNVIVCNKATAEKYDLKTLSDLAIVSKDIVIGAPPEFADRTPFGIPGLQDIYGTHFKAFEPLAIGQPIADALESNAIQCGNLFSTMSIITTAGFVPLEDDKVAVPNEAVVPLIAKDVATPAVQAVLDQIDGQLDTEQLKAMMVEVEQDGKAPADVARAWLEQNQSN